MTKRVVRRWEARVARTDLSGWVSTYRDRVLEGMRDIDGFLGVAFHAEREADPCKVTVLTTWDDMESVRRFAGGAPEKAVVPDYMQDFFVAADPEATFHDEILLEANE